MQRQIHLLFLENQNWCWKKVLKAAGPNNTLWRIVSLIWSAKKSNSLFALLLKGWLIFFVSVSGWRSVSAPGQGSLFRYEGQCDEEQGWMKWMNLFTYLTPFPLSFILCNGWIRWIQWMNKANTQVWGVDGHPSMGWGGKGARLRRTMRHVKFYIIFIVNFF